MERPWRIHLQTNGMKIYNHQGGEGSHRLHGVQPGGYGLMKRGVLYLQGQKSIFAIGVLPRFKYMAKSTDVEKGNDFIVVTGAAGFIGSCLTGLLNQHGYNNLILVDEF